MSKQQQQQQQLWGKTKIAKGTKIYFSISSEECLFHLKINNKEP